MGDAKISSLKPENREIVLNNQEKYNQNLDELNDQEIGVLMTEKQITSKDELFCLKGEENNNATELKTNEADIEKEEAFPIFPAIPEYR